MEWIDVKNALPEPLDEVLVWVDGHRGPSWRNNHALVAYLSGINYKWYEERHGNEVIGVMKWCKITLPE